jgi:RNA polymerase sigma-70 factor (ECF subfamily)
VTSDDTNPSSGTPSAFVTTQWTRVLEARGDSPDAKAALSDLCAAYYAPVFAFIRRNARDEETARDLTQEFFSRLLTRPSIERVDPRRGRFRSFLLGAVKHFLADMSDYASRLKRGAGQSPEPLELGTDTSTSPALQIPDPAAPSPEREFDRKWALTLLAHALSAVAEEHKAAGKSELFETLKPWLTGEAETISQGEAAARLGLNEGAVKVAIHRLRRRFREAIKHQIGQTLDNPAQVEEEMHYLLEALT